MAEGPEHGLALIDAGGLAGQLDGYRWLHATRADLLRRLGRSSDAGAAYRRAIELSDNAAERTFFQQRLADLA